MSAPARFLSRWSRLKRADATPAPVVAEPPEALPAEPSPANAVIDESPSLVTDLATLLREEASEAVRRQALKSLFADPHFNIMDGLDIYIDDYSVSEAIPPEMMAAMRQVRVLITETEEVAEDSASALPTQGGQEPQADAPAQALAAVEVSGADRDEMTHVGQKAAGLDENPSR